MGDSSANTSQQAPRVAALRIRRGRKALLNLEVIRSISAECAYNASALAEHMGISLRQLQRLFARQTGCSPRSWLREERLQTAHRLLLRSTSIKEVALSLSFPNASQFCRDFRSRFGYTPSTLKSAGWGSPREASFQPAAASPPYMVSAMAKVAASSCA
jgi:transcriptional regulator GlxA family with amidase domain